MSGSAAFAVGSGGWILVGTVAVLVLATAIGLFGGGSEISEHPRGPERGDTAGSRQSSVEDDGELPGPDGGRFPSTRGTR